VIRKGKTNPLDALEVRRLEFCPAYFEVYQIAMRYNLHQSIISWIDDNLSGRYYIGKNVLLDENQSMQAAVKIGFEKPKELSHFLLACPYLKYN